MVVALIAAWLLLGTVVLSLVARHLTVANRPVIIAATFAPYAVAPGTLAIVLFVVARSTAGAVVAAALVTLVVAIEVRTLITGPGPGNRPPDLTVMTGNLFFGKGDPARALQQARARGVDVLALQEITDEAVAAFRALGIDQEYPYSVIAPASEWEGVALWSRLPLREEHSALVGQLHRVSAVVTLDPERPADDPTVISLHIHAPWPSHPRDWVTQLAELREQIRSSPRPVIAMGDFNATVDHAPFRALLSDGCRDAVVSTRAWWRFTYPAIRWLPPLITIDHVVTRGLRATDVRSVRIPDSDHLAVIASLVRQPT